MPRKPAKPTKAKLHQPPTQTRYITDPQEIWKLAFRFFIPSSVTTLPLLASINIENAGVFGTDKPYRSMCGYRGNEQEPEACEVAILALYPGITLDQAERALTLMMKKLPKSQSKGGRTPHSSGLIEAIHFYFSRLTEDEGYLASLRFPGKNRIIQKTWF